MKTLKINGQTLIDHGTYWEIYIAMPLFGTTVALNEAILIKAKKARVDLLVRCPGGSERVTAKQWIKEGKRFEKVFLIPDRPMILYRRELAPEPDNEIMSVY